MNSKHLFVIDPIDTQTLALNSSVKLAFALHERGAKIFTAQTLNLSAHSALGAQCLCSSVSFPDKTFSSITLTAEPERYKLSYFSAVHMRKDPPFDTNYLAATWLLDRGEVLVFNSPAALRNNNEKMSVLLFPEACIESLISADVAHITAFITDSGDAIIKPLHMYAGQGIVRVQQHEPVETIVADLLRRYDAPVIVQPFYREVFAGEVRAFYAFGISQAWCLKKPAQGNFLANTASGATLLSYTPSKQEEEKITRVAQALLTLGIYFVGFDIIAGSISEINITSPRLLLPSQTDMRPYTRIASLLDKHLSR